MADTTIQDFYTALASFAQTGDEAGAKKYLEENFKNLPEDVQGEMLTRLYFEGLKDEADEVKILGEVQEKGLHLAQMLEALQKATERGQI